MGYIYLALSIMVLIIVSSALNLRKVKNGLRAFVLNQAVILAIGVIFFFLFDVPRFHYHAERFATPDINFALYFGAYFIAHEVLLFFYALSLSAPLPEANGNKMLADPIKSVWGIPLVIAAIVLLFYMVILTKRAVVSIE
jgi:hypothetical protein